MRQAERRARTIAALVRAARPLLASAGYAGTSLDAIAARAELSKGAVYAHLSSKVDLYLLVVEEVLDDAHRRLEGVARAIASGAQPGAAAASYFSADAREHAALMVDLWQVATQDMLVHDQLDLYRQDRLGVLAAAFVDAGRPPLAAREQAEMIAALIDSRLLDERLGLRAVAS